MKLAIISDIHGNVYALEAVLAAIEREEVDRLICAGDMVTPLPTSLKVWNILKQHDISLIRGNHEDYLLSYFASETSAIRVEPQLRNMAYIAELLSASVVQEFAALPLCHTVSDRARETVVICLASPSHTKKHYLDGLDTELQRDLERCQGTLLVSGHKHRPDQRRWNGKRLVSLGSVGLPGHGKPYAEYLILSSRVTGEERWEVTHKTVPYDHHKALKDYTESGCFAYGAPLSWLWYDELWTGEQRLAEFFPYVEQTGDHPQTLDE